ncbi:hypothetical protein [Phaeobacter sp. 11ANDIMAR09]|uniref:hypothetical protein n=1 Tax=Phaeobacter sp. 11ANDIMAR09 TaxID=1225647 RepID=UPI0012ED241E|nr:hypothetical protein [Phaeobacter sp. 11ANDIMAR09]
MKRTDPSDLLLIEGVIENTGNLAGELRFSSGDIRFQDQERIARPLAAFGPVESGDRYFVNAGGTIPFTVRAPVYRDNSDGFYVAEIEIDPMEAGRKLFIRERISLVFYTYASGQRTSQRLTQELDFYLEPVSSGWIVDGKEFTFLCSNL